MQQNLFHTDKKVIVKK